MRASSFFLLISLFALTAACGGSDSGHSPDPAATDRVGTTSATTLSDAEIVSLIYDPNYSVPDGFYVDARADTDRSYTIHHVLDASNTYELCTDDYQTAVDWEAADNASRTVNGVFISAVETPRYFEFVRELEYDDDVGNVAEPTSPGYARVFRCSSTNRNGVDRTTLDGYAGTINTRPVDADEIRDFTEYLWQFRFFAPARAIVLESAGTVTAQTAQRTLLLAFRHRQGADRCDLIELAAWRFHADRDTGVVDKTFTIVRSFGARLLDGKPVLCS